MTRSLILLTLNEIEGARSLIPALPWHAVDEVLAVDGGSTDGTREYLSSQGIRVVNQPRRGRGEAMRVGMAASTGEHVVFFSPDGNEDLADIVKLFEVLERGTDMAIASRFLPQARNEEDSAALPLRKWFNQLFTFIANVIWNRGPWVSDTINGFRGVRRDVFWRLRPESAGYTVEFEMTIRAMEAGLRITEIPTIERPRLGGASKAPSLRTGAVFIRLLLKAIWRRIWAARWDHDAVHAPPR